MPDNGRNSRQSDLVPEAQLMLCDCAVIGVGSIGRQVALQLAAMGVPRMRLVDPDTVGLENVAVQGYLERDIGRLKVDATADMCLLSNSRAEVSTAAARYRASRNEASGPVNCVFCCVDSIATRRRIWQKEKYRAALFVDGRMSGEMIRVVAASDEKGREHYGTTLFSGDEAYRGACTARSTIYSAAMAAALMVGQFAKWLRGVQTEYDVMLNMLSCEMTVLAREET